MNVIFIYFSEAWRRRRRRRHCFWCAGGKKAGNVQKDYVGKSRISRALEREGEGAGSRFTTADPTSQTPTEPKTEALGTEFENDPLTELENEFENDPETEA